MTSRSIARRRQNSWPSSMPHGAGIAKKTKPELAKASETSPLPMVAVDCTSWGSSTCSEFGVSGYPSIKFFDDSAEEDPVDYSGGRTKGAFLKFMQKQDPDYVPPPFE